MMNKKYFLYLTIPLLLNLVSCSVLDVPLKAYTAAKEFAFPAGEKLNWEQVSIGMGPGANKDFPLTVDVVIVLKESLVSKISNLSAKDWFQAKRDFIQAFDTHLVVKSWELAPKDVLRIPAKMFGDERIFAAFAFADYLVLGDHRVRIDQLEGVILLEFGDDSFAAFGKKIKD